MPTFGVKHMKTLRYAAVALTAIAVHAIALPAVSQADPAENLKSKIDAVRSEAGCPALQLDPILSNIGKRVADEVDAYVKHTATSLPITGLLDLRATGSGGLLQVMRESGYGTNDVQMLNGYGDYRTGGTGDNEDKAIKATALQAEAFGVFDDCGRYTKYGLSAINDDGRQGWPSTPPRAFSVTAVILAGPK